MVKVQRVLLVSSLLIACAVALSAPGGALAAPAKAPGACVRRHALEADDAERSRASIGEVGAGGLERSPTSANVAAPAKTPTTRSNAFQKQVWQVTAVVDRYRVASNGEIVLVLFDVRRSQRTWTRTSANPQCLSKTSRGRADMLAARTAVSHCPQADDRLAAARRDRRGHRRRLLEPVAYDEGRADRTEPSSGPWSRSSSCPGCGTP